MNIRYNSKEWQSLLGLLKLRRISTTANKYGKQTRKTRFQTLVLNNVFEISKFPSTSTIIDIALLINVHPKSIQKWFQNTRQMTKKRDIPIDEYSDSTPTIVDIPISTLYMLLVKARRECLIIH
ncbi:homeobox domain-containing protein [Vairimorpha apis BRL 01]|uniref:Homeobox domain-containing protein n=1 Tax=Vairimorpha apis BRL 01 TaxID=1037528 RepID=T0L5W8_9MICR|nr:homeobox domain-containing protein [Vairimorpha apis BRL 01]